VGIIIEDSSLNQKHENYMRRALELADFAFKQGEVPIGAVVVCNDSIVGEGYNQTISTLDPSAHAEMVAIRQAAKRQANYRLVDCDLYVTIEPCSMCAGLLVHSRIRTLIFGASEPKAGAICSASNIEQQSHFNHRFNIESGVLADECAQIMSRFFQERRERKKALKQYLSK
jgi:tRNA(adenine34) deaminase